MNSHSEKKQSGAALVVVLGGLVLLLGLALAFFVTTTGESRNSAAFSEGNRARMLSESTAGYVIGQLRDATCQDRTDLLWTSQPGLIRTFDSSGSPATSFKLYSSSQPRVTGSFNPTADLPPADWRTRPAEYVDLNAPVRRGEGTNSRIFYPILDPRAEGRVEGFSINSTWKLDTNNDGVTDAPMPVEWMYVLEDGSIGPASAGTVTNPIIGRVAFWADDDTCKLNINTASAGSFWDVPRATSAMEIRLGASIPVQGEFQRLPGHPASTSLSPVFSALGDILLPDPQTVRLDASNFKTAYVWGANTAGATSYYRPFVNFFNLTPRINGSLTDNSSWAGARRTTSMNYGDASTWNATTSAWPQDGLLSQNATTPPPGGPILADTDRLYNDIDEFLFKPDRTLNTNTISAEQLAVRSFFLTAQSRAPETTLFNTPKISLWPINVQTGDRTVKDRLLAFCGTIGGKNYFFDREIGSGGYLASNNNGAESPTADISRSRNTQLIGYLRNLTSENIPGFGGSFNAKWGSSGVDKVIAQTFDLVRANINADFVRMGSLSYCYGAFPSNPRSISVNSLGALTSTSDQSAARGYVVPSRLGTDAVGAGRYLTIAGVSIVVMPTEVVNTYANATLTNNATWSGTETCIGGQAPVFNPPHSVGNSTDNLLNPLTVPTSQKTNRVRAYVLFQPYSPTPGAPSFGPGGRISISGLNGMIISGDSNIGSAVGPASAVTRFGASAGGNQYALMNFQMTSPAYFFNFPSSAASGGSGSNNYIKWPGSSGSPGPSTPTGVYTTPLDTTYAFVSDDIDVSNSNTFNFSGGVLDVEIQTWRDGNPIQTFQFDFPPVNGIPLPQHRTSPGIRQTAASSPTWSGNELAQGRLTAAVSNNWITGGLEPNKSPGTGQPPDQNFGDYLALWRRMRLNGNSNYLSNNLIRTGDVVFSLVPTNTMPIGGDLRMIALSRNVDSNFFTPVAGYGSTFMGSGTMTPALIRNDAVIIQTTSTSPQLGWMRNTAGNFTSFLLPEVSQNATLVGGLAFGNQAVPISAPGMLQANLGASGASASGILGDWNSPSGAAKDGASLPRPEAGIPSGIYGGFWDLGTAAFNHSIAQDNTFEPNRIVPSSGLLGGIMAPNSSGSLQPWRTLLFSAWPAAGRAFDASGSGSESGGHPGSMVSPKDHLFLDNFWMPVVEPYAISEPLATSGKVNLNFQIAPFTYITRSTALRGALTPVMVGGVLNSLASANGSASYKYGLKRDPISTPIRYPLAMNETIDEFSKRFQNGGVFRSATSVCEVPLVPMDSSGAPFNLNTFWNGRSATADNLREQPYTALLSRVTTQSNTYTVHIRVESIKKVPGTPANQFVPGRDQITGEWRGSCQIERYVDANDPDLQNIDFASGALRSLGPFYKFRILSMSQFAP